MPKSLNILKYFIYAGIFLIPFIAFIVSSSMFFPFITGKNFVFRIIIEVVGALWLILAIFDGRYRPKKNWILITLTAFVGIMFLSSIFGENFYRSFWSNYERMEGVVTHLHLLLYFFVLGGMMKTERVWKNLFHTTLFASVIMAFYGLFQLMGVFATHQGNRLDASLGNASYLAVYMLFHIFLAMVLYYRSADYKKWIYLFVVILESVVLYYTATRGAILGIIGGFIISWILIAIFSKNTKSRLIHAGLICVIATMIAGFWFLKDAKFVEKSPVLNRFSRISLQERTTESRLTIWKMSWEAFKDKPLLGWGQENYNLVFNQYYEPVLYKQEPWFDRAHNVFFDRLTTNGLFGFLAYIGLLGAALYCLWAKRAVSGFSTKESAIFTGAFVAYFFNNLFVFDNLISLILFVVFLAYIGFRSNGAKQTQPAVSSFNYGKAMAAVAIGAAAMFVIYYVNVPGILTSRAIIDAFKAQGQGDAKGAFENFKKAIGYNSFGKMEAREHLTSFAMQVYSASSLDQAFRNEVADYAVEQLKKQNEEYPNDIREMVFLANIYNKVRKYDEAIAVLDNAIKISPKKQQLYFELGTSYLNKGEYVKGMETLRRSFELDESFEQARIIYAVAAIFAGDEKLAEELMKDYGGTLQADERFLRAYAQKNDPEKVTAILLKLIEKEPGNIQHRLNLASVYLQKGERTKSIEQIQKVIEMNPAFKEQGEYYINEIKAGRNP
ncbi:tetratricopeptide repeat protein [Candidatus Parcubacteria bacterium]|nr:MAG: tetratricopeptide repeat protein [Candidatus Parcubacteria bacterium]